MRAGEAVAAGEIALLGEQQLDEVALVDVLSEKSCLVRSNDHVSFDDRKTSEVSPCLCVDDAAIITVESGIIIETARSARRNIHRQIRGNVGGNQCLVGQGDHPNSP